MDLSIQLEVPAVPLFKGDAGRIVNEELVAATEFGVNLFESTIVPLTPIDRGLLRGGIQTQVLGQGGGSADVIGRVFNPLAYAVPVEGGTVPHFPPVAALEAWAKRKLGVEGLGYVIARAIAKRGTKAVLMFKRGFDAARPRVEARYQQALQRIAARLVGK